jgi:ABC-type antimicrobial peptide transport system permease subunit
LLAVVAPIEKIKEFNEWYHNEKNFRYSRVILKIKSPEAFEKVKKSAEEMNLLVSSEKKTLEQFLFLLKSIFAIIFVFTVFILFLSMMMIMNHYSLVFLERRNEIGIFRAIGGTPWQTFLLYFFEIFFIGFVSSCFGFIAFKIAINFLNQLLVNYTSSIMILPKVIFYSPIWLFIIIISAGIVLSLLTILPLIFRFVLCQPAELLNED